MVDTPSIQTLCGLLSMYGVMDRDEAFPDCRSCTRIWALRKEERREQA